ncbi:hypothetical protein B0A48_04398 [Cryoendolithus antarcticus]|uniref:Uncharacterized protein n=1 Tax=Cryoendolithus antarcticus TaxID=1507870 RepID=A0A1V8TFP0_9PEZI|nr:hypothetical protein B0A48_04398 [Cryoendolithus antarcticus]
MCPGPNPEKTCGQCSSNKSLNAFPPDAGTTDGYSDICADCSKKKKECTQCGIEKLLVEGFYKTSRGNYQPRCKACHNQEVGDRKTCKGLCGLEKPMDDFPGAGRGRYKAKCKDCMKDEASKKPDMSPDDRKTCKGLCGLEKPINDFRKSGKGTYRAKCKDCTKDEESKKPDMSPDDLRACKGTCGLEKPIKDFARTSKGNYKVKCKDCTKDEVPDDQRECRGPCGLTKPVGDFHGYRKRCKDCEKSRITERDMSTLTGDMDATGGDTAEADDESEEEDTLSSNPRLAELQRVYRNLFRRPTTVDRRYTRGADYWVLSKEEILSRYTDLQNTLATRPRLIRALQRDEAARGYLPIPRSLHSPYHYLEKQALVDLARRRGWTAFENAEESRLASERDEDRALATEDGDGDTDMLDVHDTMVPAGGPPPGRISVSAIDPRPLDPRLRSSNNSLRSPATTLDEDDMNKKLRGRRVRFLLQQDHSSEVDFWETMDDASQQALAAVLVDDLTVGLGLKPRTREAYERCSSTLNQASQLRRVRIGGVVGITGTQTAFDSLYHLLHQGQIVPQATSSRGLLCGVYALERSLRFMQQRLYRNNPGLWQVDPSIRFIQPPPVRYTDMMNVLFSDWDPLRQYNDGDTATPTPAYDAYIRQQYSSLLATGVDAVLFNDAYIEMTRVTNLDAFQLQAILTLLHNGGNNPDMPMHYQLGVIRSGYWRDVPGTAPAQEEAVPAHVRFINNFDSNHARQAALFVHNRVALGDGYSHFEGMDDSGGSGYYDVLSWGMRVNADEHYVPGRAGNEDLDEASKTDNDRRLAKNERVRTKAAAKREHTGCIPCREQNRQCTGDVWQVPCPQCQDTELYDDGDAPNCTWDDHLRPMQFIPSNATPQQREVMMQRWNTPFNPDNIIAGFVAVDPVPAVRHFLVIALARTSSARDPATMAAIAADQQITLHHYDNMLNAGPNANIQVVHFPVGQRPTDENGGYLHMRKARFTIARHGTRAVPTTAGNVNNPAVIRLVALFHEVFAYQQPVPANHPYEIHMLLNGFAGLSVGIPAWGSLVPWEGFYAWVSDLDIQNHTALAERIFIVVLAEPHVVDGVLPHSLEFPNRTARWPRHRGKHMHKRRLVDLLTRNEDLRAAALGYAPLPQRWPAADEHDLDVILEAMFNEARYRSGQLDALTAPSVQDVAARNTGRNAPLR